MKKTALLLLVVLTACVPTTHYLPPDTPIRYPTSYRNLFSATLQELTAAYVPDGLGRRTFAITRADLETGLITAVRSEQGTTANLRYRFPNDDDDTPFGLGFSLLVPVPVTPLEQTIITIVVRPQGRGASIIYSTQGPDGSSSGDAERLMGGVVAGLDARFLKPVQMPAQPLEPVTP